MGVVAQQLHGRQGGHGFAGPGFAHQRDGFAFVDMEGHAPDRGDQLAVLLEGHL